MLKLLRRVFSKPVTAPPQPDPEHLALVRQAKELSKECMRAAHMPLAAMLEDRAFFVELETRAGKDPGKKLDALRFAVRHVSGVLASEHHPRAALS